MPMQMIVNDKGSVYLKEDEFFVSTVARKNVMVGAKNNSLISFDEDKIPELIHILEEYVEARNNGPRISWEAMHRDGNRYSDSDAHG